MNGTRSNFSTEIRKDEARSVYTRICKVVCLCIADFSANVCWLRRTTFSELLES